jgi:hypothetical protein
VTIDPLGGAREKLEKIHEKQVHRDGWPDFAAFDPARYPESLRRPASRQWMRRANEELGSYYEFSTLARALAGARAPVQMLGALSRLITDEVRHAELCGTMARVVWPEGETSAPDAFRWFEPKLPFEEPPPIGAKDDVEPVHRWAADAILCSCCIGETLSRPLFESVATVCTDETSSAVLRQILRDEHLHATFGWEALAELLPRLGKASRAWLQKRLAERLGAFELGAVHGVTLEELAGKELVVEPGDPAKPNLAILDSRTYAMIFYATIESEILPRFAELGFDATGAWAARPRGA